MKRRTYNNMVKATKLIAAKGYDWNTANEIAIKVFDDMEATKNGMSAEWWISFVAEASEYESRVC